MSKDIKQKTSFFDLSETEQKQVVNTAAQKANEEQKKLMTNQPKQEGWRRILGEYETYGISIFLSTPEGGKWLQNQEAYDYIQDLLSQQKAKWIEETRKLMYHQMPDKDHYLIPRKVILELLETK